MSDGARAACSRRTCVDQHLPVVQASEQFLAPLQPAQIGILLRASGFEPQLDAVPQLLERDADRVQPFGQIKRAGCVDGRSESGGPPRDSRLQRPLPARACSAGYPLFPESSRHSPAYGSRGAAQPRPSCRRPDRALRHARAGPRPRHASKRVRPPRRDSCSSSIRGRRTSSSRTGPRRRVTLRSLRSSLRVVSWSSWSIGNSSRSRRDATRAPMDRAHVAFFDAG